MGKTDERLLEVHNLSAGYGIVNVLESINLKVNRGEIVTIIGNNGAGKTTFMRAISGMIKCKGDVLFEGKKINLLPAHKIVRLGISHVPQGRLLFSGLSVVDNLRLGAVSTHDNHREVREVIQRMLDKYSMIRDRKMEKAGMLSGGEQQILAIIRGMMSRPKLLLVDEPSIGLAPKLVKEVFVEIKKICDSGISVMISEQLARKAMQFSHRTYVIENGRIVMEGSSKELIQDKRVEELFVGKA